MPEHTALEDLEQSPHAEVFDHPRPRTVRLQLEADQRMPPHTHPGTDVVLHLLSGRLDLSVGDRAYDLRAGDLVRFSGDREVSPHAIDPSTAIVVFAPTSDGDA